MPLSTFNATTQTMANLFAIVNNAIDTLNGFVVSNNRIDAANVNVSVRLDVTGNTTLHNFLWVESNTMVSNLNAQWLGGRARDEFVMNTAFQTTVGNVSSLHTQVTNLQTNASSFHTQINGKLTAASNLSDVGSAATSFNNIKQNALEGTTGVVDHATASQIWGSTAGNHAINSGQLANSAVVQSLTDGANVAVDWAAGINYTVTLAGNRNIDKPTNAKAGQTRTILVKGNDGNSRTLTFSTHYTGEVPTLADIQSFRWYLLTIQCIDESNSYFAISSKRAFGSA